MDANQLDDHDAMTHKGHKIWFLKPELTYIDLEDIKYATSNICRYNGHMQWSLLQHLALCSELVAYDYDKGLVKDFDYLQAQAACHDIHEIYVGDIITGLKNHLNEFKTIENIWEKYVLNCLWLDLPQGENKRYIKYIDLRALTLEMVCGYHPAAKHVIARYGPPTPEEIEIYNSVKFLRPEYCWLIVDKAIEKWRMNGKDRDQQPNGLS